MRNGTASPWARLVASTPFLGFSSDPGLFLSFVLFDPLEFLFDASTSPCVDAERLLAHHLEPFFG